MYAKIQINGILEVKTGMHIGASSAFSAIGAVDSPVIRDVYSNQPMIPGTSFKGKIRSLLAKSYNEKVSDPDNDDERLLRLFGCARKNHVQAGRLLVGDMFLINETELRSQGIQTMTEIKFENSIKRTTAVANPRQIERTVRGAKFKLDIVYDIQSADNADEALRTASEDIETLANGLRLLQIDYLGGSGTRGYGRVAFSDIKLNCVYGQVADDNLAQWEKTLTDAIALS